MIKGRAGCQEDEEQVGDGKVECSSIGWIDAEKVGSRSLYITPPPPTEVRNYHVSTTTQTRLKEQALFRVSQSSLQRQLHNFYLATRFSSVSDIVFTKTSTFFCRVRNATNKCLLKQATS